MKSKILLIYTGGTLGMDYKDDNPSLWLESKPIDFLLNKIDDFDSIKKITENNEQIFEVIWNENLLHFFSFKKPIDSSNINISNWQLISKYINYFYDYYDGFVILHGTDTMAYSASMLSFIFQFNKPIIFTGSKLPIGFKNSDAWINMQTAIKFSSFDLVRNNVWIAIDDYVIQANRTTKIGGQGKLYQSLKSNVKTYYLNDIDKSLSISTEKKKKNITYSYKPDLVSGVLPIYIVPEIFLADYLESVFDIDHIHSYLFLTYGSGNAPQSIQIKNLINKAINNGKNIGYISQCPAENTKNGAYGTNLKLLNEKIINLTYMSVEAAYTKFIWAKANVVDLQLKDFMEKDFNGELNN